MASWHDFFIYDFDAIACDNDFWLSKFGYPMFLQCCVCIISITMRQGWVLRSGQIHEFPSEESDIGPFVSNDFQWLKYELCPFRSSVSAKCFWFGYDFFNWHVMQSLQKFLSKLVHLESRNFEQNLNMFFWSCMFFCVQAMWHVSC